MQAAKPMKPWLKWTIALLVLALLAAGALRTLSARKDKQVALAAQQAAQKSEVAIELTETDLLPVKVVDLALTVAISGPVKAVNSAMVKARVPGELQNVTVREGDSVQAGQVLGRIDPTESQARLRQTNQQAQAAKAQVDIAQRTHDNNVALVAQGFISSTALAASQANLAAVQANYAAAQSATDVVSKSLSDTVLRAPISGQVAQRLAQSGERVALDGRILEIVDLSRLELEAAMSAADAMQVKVGQRAQLHVAGLPQPLTASVVRINPSATADSRAVLVYLALASGSPLRQGLFAEGSLTTGHLSTLSVSLSAVRTDKPQPYVQVLQANQVQHLNVTLGARGELDGKPMVAVSGVPEGAMALAQSVGVLRPGTQVKLLNPSQGKL
jgi:RND family efflux transporter MFP subunit